MGHCLRKLFAPDSENLALLSDLLSELESLLDDVEKSGNDEKAVIRKRVSFFFQKMREFSIIGFGKATIYIKYDY